MTFKLHSLHGPAVPRGARRGRVLTAHARAANLLLDDGQVLSLLHPALGNGPGALLVAGPWPLPCQAGDAVLLTDGALQVSGMSLDLRAAPRWEPPLAPPICLSRAVLDSARSALAEQGSHGGLLPAALAAMGGAPASGTLQEMALRGIASLAAGSWADGVRQLAGLGPGLTPSGDDLLAGYAVVCHRAGDKRAGALSAALRDLPQGATGPLSRHFLQWAAEGVASEHSLAWVDGLLTQFDAPIGPVLAHGATSGADWAAGALLALYHLLEEDSYGHEAV